ncbi:HAD family hydrolase [Anabaena sp. AL09]|uniref:HAD family hydrolase n=1 Tax=Anabaena sp. AL09 TaxID=1710891 RepID=UPI0007FE8CF1|nr:HAD family hydrolase [Anabaena sp. AL09]OBQ13227.1 MAG: HAD family hydrolase [Anabaena sp. AL09]
MLSHTVLFDLDGTLTDPKPGITRCIQYALSELGYKPPDANELLWCIGPPLKSSFSQLLQTSDDTLLEEAISLYRSRFSTIGLFENSLYPQIPKTLKIIRAAGYQTFVATSKPQVYATRIIEYFDLAPFFDGVYGSELDGNRSVKGDLIYYIIERESLSASTVVMVGDSEALLQADRLHDIIGAKKNNIASIGVTYGYGSREELETHKADLIADYPDEIPTLLPLI